MTFGWCPTCGEPMPCPVHRGTGNPAPPPNPSGAERQGWDAVYHGPAQGLLAQYDLDSVGAR